MNTKVLLINSSPYTDQLVRTALEQSNLRGFELETVNDPSSFQDYINQGEVGVVLFNLPLSDSSALSMIREISSLPVVVLTEVGDDEMGLNTLRLGAQDYVMKDQIDPYLLSQTIVKSIERKQAMNEVLTRERNLLHTVIDHMPDRVYAKDREGHYIIANAATLRQMKTSKMETIVGKTDSDFYAPELVERYQADDQLVLQYGQWLINREEPAPNPEGGLLWMLTTKVPLRDQNGDVDGLVGIGRDITRLKNTQEQLLKSNDEIERLYRISRLLGQTLDPKTIYTTLQEAIITYMDCGELYISSYVPAQNITNHLWAWKNGALLEDNDALPTHLAYAEKKVQNWILQSAEILYLPDYPAWLREQDSSILLEEVEPYSALFIPLRLKGQFLGIIQVFSYHPDAYPEDKRRFLEALAPHAAAATANALLYQRARREITERARAEAALYKLNEVLEQRIADRTLELRKSEAHYRAVVEDQMELVCRYLPDTTITFVNNAYCRFFNQPHDSLIGSRFSTIVPEEEWDSWEKRLANLTLENPVMAVEHRTMAGDGKVHWLQWTNRLIINDGNLVEIQGVGRDITRQKQTDDVLRQALTHEIELNIVRSRFVSMASHDLRTPLAIIQATTDLLAEYSERLSSERKAEGYRQIQTSIRHMVELLDDILLVARAEAGKLEFAPEQLAVKSFCHNVLTELRTSIGTQHRLEFIADGEYEENIWADPKLLRNIISNLVSNAIKYSPADSVIQVYLEQTPGLLLLSVEDQGMGIPLEDQKNLFKTFFRAKNVGNIPGTGLGLAIVQQSVELCGGSVTFKSMPGEGTTFFVTLPYISTA